MYAVSGCQVEVLTDWKCVVLCQLVVLLAAKYGHADTCRLLLERSAAPNAARRDGYTPCTHWMLLARGRVGTVCLRVLRCLFSPLILFCRVYM